MKNYRYLTYIVVIFLSILASHLFFINQTTYIKTDVTIKIGRNYNTSSLKPVIIEDVAMVIERVKSKNFQSDTFGQELLRYLPEVEFRSFRNGDSLVLSIISNEEKIPSLGYGDKVMTILANGLINSHQEMREKIGLNSEGKYIFTATHITNQAKMYEHKKYTSYMQILFFGFIFGIIAIYIISQVLGILRKEN